MITNLHDFKRLNEVRLPNGYFNVERMFTLPLEKEGTEDSASSIFNVGNIIEINTQDKYIKKWGRVFNGATGAKTKEWKSTTYPYVDLMDPAYYNSFKQNTVRLQPEETPDFYQEHKEIPTILTTTIKQAIKKLELLDPNAKVKITFL